MNVTEIVKHCRVTEQRNINISKASTARSHYRGELQQNGLRISLQSKNTNGIQFHMQLSKRILIISYQACEVTSKVTLESCERGVIVRQQTLKTCATQCRPPKLNCMLQKKCLIYRFLLLTSSQMSLSFLTKIFAQVDARTCCSEMLSLLGKNVMP